ncbi:MAG: hypothetical protein IPO14_13050 [Saprospiraceae bacterium]|nr:hypothetical protein [Saprospiraceae bacterium]
MCRIRYRIKYNAGWEEKDFDGSIGGNEDLNERPSDARIARCLGYENMYNDGRFKVDYFEWTETRRY